MEYKSAVFRNTIRATFAITVATIIAYFIPYKNSWWIQLTAILLMQVSFGASIKRSKGIIIGTIFGVLSGVLFAALSQTYSYLLIIIPLSVFLGSYMLAFFYSGAIFMFSILIIMLLSLHDKMSIDLWHFALVRLLDITIGIAIVISTSLFLFPAWAKDDFRENLAEGIKYITYFCFFKRVYQVEQSLADAFLFLWLILISSRCLLWIIRYFLEAFLIYDPCQFLHSFFE